MTEKQKTKIVYCLLTFCWLNVYLLVCLFLFVCLYYCEQTFNSDSDMTVPVFITDIPALLFDNIKYNSYKMEIIRKTNLLNCCHIRQGSRQWLQLFGIDHDWSKLPKWFHGVRWLCHTATNNARQCPPHSFSCLTGDALRQPERPLPFAKASTNQRSTPSLSVRVPGVAVSYRFQTPASCSGKEQSSLVRVRERWRRLWRTASPGEKYVAAWDTSYFMDHWGYIYGWNTLVSDVASMIIPYK